MNLVTWRSLFALVLLIGMLAGDAPGQTAAELRQDRLHGELEIQNQRISEQRVQRQNEVVRLEKLIERLESRVIRLERQLLSTSRFPAITVAEAEAALRFSDARLNESERDLVTGNATDVEVARDRLAVVQAHGQLEIAKAANNESILILELDVVHAERHLREETQRKLQLERLVAKGFATSDGLQLQMLDVTSAEKQLQLARLRLETQKKLIPANKESTQID